ncbi:hypothetical protein [Nocardia jejuensis]|uniref:hypothetical protein n=1 Tax=Nocardia jejuensis TaxID=328049 RepID=UPI0008304A23|nr:hypothetical protein [Nocardia jejuensis]
MHIADVVAERARETQAVLANLNSYYEALADLDAEEMPDPSLRYQCWRFLRISDQLADARERRMLEAEIDPVEPVMELVRELLATHGASVDALGIGAALEGNGWEPPAGVADRLELIEAACTRLAEQPNSAVTRNPHGEYEFSSEGTPAPQRPRSRKLPIPV